MVLPCQYIDEFSCGPSHCSELAPGWLNATADVRAGADRKGRADGTCGGHSAWLVLAAKCETSGSGPGLGQAAGSVSVLCALSSSCLALAVLFVPFARDILNCFFHKIMEACPPRILKFPLPRLDEWTALPSLFSLLLDWLCQPWRNMLFSTEVFSLPLLILSTVICQLD